MPTQQDRPQTDPQQLTPEKRYNVHVPLDPQNYIVFFGIKCLCRKTTASTVLAQVGIDAPEGALIDRRLLDDEVVCNKCGTVGIWLYRDATAEDLVENEGSISSDLC